MSRSQPENEIINPCKKWWSWDSDSSQFKFYDKETKKNVLVKLPFRFLVLDRLTTCVGYNDPKKIGYYSNEVRDVKNDILTVRSKNGIEAVGTWEQVKAKLGSDGLGFCQSTYIMYFEGKEPMLGNIKMSGACIEPWFAFTKANNIMEIGVSVASFSEHKKGKVEYTSPVFTAMKVSEESNAKAIELDKVLQNYLTAYLLKNKTSTDKAQPEVKLEATATKPEVKVAETVAPIVEALPDDFDENAPF